MKTTIKEKLKHFIERALIEFKKRKRFLYLIEFYKDYKGTIKFLGFCCLFGYLLIGNMDVIMHPPDQSLGYKTIAKMIVLTDTNLQVLAIGAAYALATGALYLLRLPFANIEQVKLPWLEIKEQIKQTEMTENLKQLRESEVARFAFIQILGDPEIVADFQNLMNGKSFDIYLTADLLARTIEDYYIENLGVVLPTRILLVEDGIIRDDNKFYSESPFVRKLIKEAITIGDYTCDKKPSLSAIAVPLMIPDYPETQCVLYSESNGIDFVLGESDCKMVQISWSHIQNIQMLKYLGEELEKGIS